MSKLLVDTWFDTREIARRSLRDLGWLLDAANGTGDSEVSLWFNRLVGGTGRLEMTDTWVDGVHNGVPVRQKVWKWRFLAQEGWMDAVLQKQEGKS